MSYIRICDERDGEAREFEWRTVGLTFAPIVSCYWHSRDAGERIIHVSAGAKHVYTTDAHVDAWKKMDD